jgi:hypothetical protein
LAAVEQLYSGLSLKTMMATSGHISAHKAQPVHFSGPEKTATVYPRLLGVELMETSFFGQAMVHNPHPLQRSSLMVICGMVILPCNQFDI